MLDVEYVLRVVVYFVLGFEKYFYKINDDFLCYIMKVFNVFYYDKDKGVFLLDRIFQIIDYKLKELFKMIFVIFEDDVFKKEFKGKLNKILFELLVFIFVMMFDEQWEIMVIFENVEFFKKIMWDVIFGDEKMFDWEFEIYKELGRGFDYFIINFIGK